MAIACPEPIVGGLARTMLARRAMVSESRRASQVGRVVASKYELVRLLGEGAMGAVYEAKHLIIGRRVAVKLVHAELARRSDLTIRFTREARAAGSLESENIAAVTDFGHDADGTPFLVMEYLIGVELGQLLRAEGPLPVARACRLLLQACDGLAHAHAKGIVHRDLKPENLFVLRRSDGTDLLKILDFGIAKLTAVEGQSATQTGSTLGTPYYMPPEQVRGVREVDHRADLWSLGVILYELLSQERPHPGNSNADVMLHVLNRKPVPLATHRPGLPDALVAVVERAMSMEPNDRFQSAAEMRAALVPFLGSAGVPHPALTPVPSTTSSGGPIAGPTGTLVLPPSPQPPMVSRSSGFSTQPSVPMMGISGKLLAAAIVAGLALAGICVAVAGRWRDQPRPKVSPRAPASIALPSAASPEPPVGSAASAKEPTSAPPVVASVAPPPASAPPPVPSAPPATTATAMATPVKPPGPTRPPTTTTTKKGGTASDLYKP